MATATTTCNILTVYTHLTFIYSQFLLRYFPSRSQIWQNARVRYYLIVVLVKTLSHLLVVWIVLSFRHLLHLLLPLQVQVPTLLTRATVTTTMAIIAIIILATNLDIHYVSLILANMEQLRLLFMQRPWLFVGNGLLISKINSKY